MKEKTSATAFDEAMMRRALDLARKGRMWVSPNPMVGAVVVQGGRIVGEGHHGRFGGPHAEVEALRRAGARARGAMLYVTLEPCAHQGKTPPCVDAIAEAGIARVVAAMRDPFDLVRGQGFARLRAAGVEVVSGVLREDARALNAAFVKRIETGMPLFTAKWAMSADGRVATRSGDSKYLTGEEARKAVHEERSANDAIMVGIGTILADDPLLDSRLVGGRTPLAVVVDSSCRMPVDAAVIQREGDVLVATTTRAPVERRESLMAASCEVVCLDGDGGRVDLEAVARLLGTRSVNGVLIEGGPEVFASAFAAGLVDRVMVWVAPMVVAGRQALGAVGGEGIERLEEVLQLGVPRVRAVGGDILLEYEISSP